jgi:hypothetical protein
MTGKRWFRWGATAATALVVAGVPLAIQVFGQGSASASTVPSAQVTSALTAFDSTPAKTVVAQCPAGKRVIGGGGRVNGAQHVVITRQEPVHATAGDSFAVDAREDEVGFGGSWAVQAFAICSAPVAGLQVVSATSAFSSNAFTGQSVNCPSGKFALGGGGKITNGNGQVDLSTLAEGGSVSSRTTAAGTEDLNGFAGNYSVTAFAVCATGAFADFQVVKVTSAQDSTDRKILTAECTNGKRVTGGAAFSSIPGVIESVSPDANRLRVGVIARENTFTTGTWGVTAVAFCAS